MHSPGKGGAWEISRGTKNREKNATLSLVSPTTTLRGVQAAGGVWVGGASSHRPMNPDEKRIAAKQCLEAKYTRVNKLKEDREMRKQNLRAKMEEMQLDPETQQEAEYLHNRTETEHLRSQRLKLSVQDFEQLDIIGRGAFGEVHMQPCGRNTDTHPGHTLVVHCTAGPIMPRGDFKQDLRHEEAQEGRDGAQGAGAPAARSAVCSSLQRLPSRRLPSGVSDPCGSPGRCNTSMQSWR